MASLRKCSWSPRRTAASAAMLSSISVSRKSYCIADRSYEARRSQKTGRTAADGVTNTLPPYGVVESGAARLMRMRTSLELLRRRRAARSGP